MAANFNQYVIDNFVATVAFEDIDLALSVNSPTSDCDRVAGITELVFFSGLTPHLNDPHRSTSALGGGSFERGE